MKAVNLLPNEQRGSAKSPAAVASPAAPGGSAFGAYAVLGALAFAVVAMAGYVLANNSIKDRQAELARITAETQATQAKASSLQSFADFKSLADQRVATVKGLADSRFDWERTLTDLSRALPSDVHLKSLAGSTGTEVGGGNGANALRGAIQAPALELSGCTTSQSGVARLMSRLRTVRGVTRVTLTKSDKDSSSTPVVAQGTSADGGTPAQLCPKGAPPAFDIVVFFERAAVAATAAPNIGAGTTAQQGATATQPNGTTPQTQQPNAAAAAQQPTQANGGAVPATPPGSQTQPPTTTGVSAP